MTKKRIFSIMNLVSWIVFLGYCIKAGAIALVSLMSLFGNKNATANLYLGLDLLKLYEFSLVHFTTVVIFLVLIASIKAFLFYQLILVFKALDINKPFAQNIINPIFQMSYIALTIGILGVFANTYLTWLRTKVFFTQIDIGVSGYIFMAGVVYIIASLFEQASKLQTENDLTI